MADEVPLGPLEELVPESFGRWTKSSRLEAVVNPQQATALDDAYDSVLSRTYVDPSGYSIMLSMAYGRRQSRDSQVHKPEVCYPAQGFEILSSNPAALSLDGGMLPVRQLVARQGRRIEPITYWIRVGDFVATNGAQQFKARLEHGLDGLIPDGLLVRVSSIDDRISSAQVVQEEFIREMLKEISARNQQGKLLGNLTRIQ